MPRRPDPDDYLAPGQMILPVAPPSDARPPIDARVWECVVCGGRNFTPDLTYTLFDPRLAPGRCSERKVNKTRCAGRWARLVPTV